MRLVLAAAIACTTIWLILDDTVGLLFGWKPANLFTVFFAALGGALMIRTSTATKRN